jgi:hypothetical protein
MDQIPS